MTRRKREAKLQRDLAQQTLPPSQGAKFAADQERRRRSDHIWLTLLGVVVMAPILYDSFRTPMQRNLYATRAECLADYSESECATEPEVHVQSARIEDRSTLRYHGPWYAETSSQRTASDPGPGRGIESGRVARTSMEAPSRYGSRPAPGFEPGMRGGFGRTGSVRAGRSGFLG
ncbi:hypothetical protein C7S18_01985 [Ahniella affigens]|uniref:Uncharacterized protein n=1 Tax=Ahniella affigens TaxID=2021234 RepID=A0A2P1PMH2_9GAMM|nr:hypothetical protein [Ahniella affigens]AVP96035.1 hypothetical protein C7S18_01985 [Ahniella affigens]